MLVVKAQQKQEFEDARRRKEEAVKVEDPSAPKPAVPSSRVAKAAAISFNRAIARADWMKEPWLLLDAPPQSVSSLDSLHNVMGSVYSVGPNKHGTDDLIEQYAKRCVDAGCCVCA